ncbi:Helix-turn-helix [uncultured archaeon]|nr:Helix-turn-helix [uncultured archaeon]
MDSLKDRIASEIIFSPKSGDVLKKWREIFGLSQIDLAKEMKVTPSTLSDYESSRRKNPGASFIGKYIAALFALDSLKGSPTISRMKGADEKDLFYELFEFKKPVDLKSFAESLEAINVSQEKPDLLVFGATSIDSVKAIVRSSFYTLVRVYGSTSQRALIFMGVDTGRSTMVALKMSPFKPACVILHGIEVNQVDKLAIALSNSEGVPLFVTKISPEKLKEKLRSFSL